MTDAEDVKPAEAGKDVPENGKGQSIELPGIPKPMTEEERKKSLDIIRKEMEDAEPMSEEEYDELFRK